MKPPFPPMTLWAGAWIACHLLEAVAFAQAERPQLAKDPPSIRTHRSAYCIVHTDLADADAAALLARLDAAVEMVSGYWGRRPRGMIECYVARDVNRWPEAKLPHPLARLVIARIGGVTNGEPETGKNAERHRRAIVYASATRGVAEHEVVHAYCLQTFGEMGPQWYSEGLAEIACHDAGRDAGVSRPHADINLLRLSNQRSLSAVVHGGEFTDGISASLKQIMDRRAPHLQTDVANEAWTAEDVKMVDQARQSYCWSWALCYLLCNNDNYAQRFQTLGQGYLQRSGDSFEAAFGPVLQELEFEFNHFVQHVEPGYRVDLCRWDWSKPFHPLEGKQKRTVRVAANRGFQPSGIALAAGSRYRYRATGTWNTSTHQNPTSADGDQHGTGRLVGVVMSGYQLGEPIELGESGTFVAPSDGYLYVRCHDGWSRLADNRGSVTVRFQRD